MTNPNLPRFLLTNHLATAHEKQNRYVLEGKKGLLLNDSNHEPRLSTQQSVGASSHQENKSFPLSQERRAQEKAEIVYTMNI